MQLKEVMSTDIKKLLFVPIVNLVTGQRAIITGVPGVQSNWSSWGAHGVQRKAEISAGKPPLSSWALCHM